MMRAAASGDRHSLTPAVVLGLQRTHGNQFVQRQLSLTPAAVQSIQRSPDSDELQKVFTTSGSTAALDWLKNFQKSDADVEAFVKANFTGDDLWYGTNLMTYGPETSWPPVEAAKLELKAFSGSIRSTELLKALSKVGDPEFDTLMTGMTQAQTDQFLTNLTPGDIKTYGPLVEKVKTTRILKTGQAMVGKLKWRGGSGPDTSKKYQIDENTNWGKENNFAKWINGPGPEPGAPDDTMNCWQGVLFMAYKAGVVKKSWLVKIHQDAAKKGEAASDVSVYYDALEANMHSGSLTAVPFDSVKKVRTGPVPAGNIIFIDSLDHVVISKGKTDPNGKNEVLSLWILPAPGKPLGGWTGNEVGVLQDTTLEDVSTDKNKVEYAPAPW
jgi:hypothetical protein